MTFWIGRKKERKYFTHNTGTIYSNMILIVQRTYVADVSDIGVSIFAVWWWQNLWIRPAVHGDFAL